MSDNGILEEIGRFDQDYVAAERESYLPGIEALRDGVHVLEIVKAELSRTKKTGEAILKMILRAQDGLTVERAYFFRTQDAVDRLGADLCQLGFDADRWNGRHNRRFSVELQKAIPKLAGVRFQAKKETKPNPEGGKDFHNLYVSILVGGPKANGSGVGNATVAPASSAPAKPQQRPQAEEVGGVESYPDDIPF